MNDLFIQPVQFEKVSYKRVSENPAEWTGNIMESFYNQFPYFAQTPLSVTLTQKDEAKGYALGQITIQEGAGMTVPIIIQNRELFPFDVAIINGVTMPLTNTTLNIYVQSRGAFLKTVKPEAGDITNSLFNTSFSQQVTPTYVTESYKQAEYTDHTTQSAEVAAPIGQSGRVKKETDEKEKKKTASVLDSILPTITQDMKNEFFDVLQKNASVVEGFKRNGTSDLILKIATIAPTSIDFKDRVRKELDRDIQYIYKTANHEAKMVLGSSRVVDKVEVSIDEQAYNNMPHITTPATYETTIEKNADIKSHFITNTGRRFVVFDNDDYIELEPNIKVAMAPGHSTFASWTHGAKTAFWLGDNFTSDPFTVLNVWNDDGTLKVEATDGLSKTAYVRMKGIDWPYSENGVTYIPDSLYLMKLGNRIDVPEKTIDIWANANKITRDDVDDYRLEGNTFNEFLKTSAKTLSGHDAVWTVLQLGGTKDDVLKIAQLKQGQSYSIPHEMNIPLSFDTVSAKWEEEYSKTAAKINGIAKNFIKEASVLNDVPTVDAILSLNFVNKNNIQDFAQALPSFMSCAQKLSDLLLKTRVGVRIVDEGMLRRVMLGLVDVIEVLEGISNLSGRH